MARITINNSEPTLTFDLESEMGDSLLGEEVIHLDASDAENNKNVDNSKISQGNMRIGLFEGLYLTSKRARQSPNDMRDHREESIL